MVVSYRICEISVYHGFKHLHVYTIVEFCHGFWDAPIWGNLGPGPMAFGLLCGVDFGRGMSGEADGAVPGMQQVLSCFLKRFEGPRSPRNISISGNEYWVNCRKSFLRRNFMRWLSSNLSSTARPSWSRRLLVFGRFGWIRFGRTAAFPSLFVIFNSGYLRPLVECAQMSMGQNSQNPDTLRCENQNSWYMNIHPPNIWYNHVCCIIGILQ
jgi:hypothetical protein